MAILEFDIGKWLGRIVIEPGNYQSLYEFAESKPHLDSHTYSRSVISGEGDIKTVADMDDVIKGHVVATFTSSVQDALDTFSSQMIVLAFAFFEGMTQEFVQAVFAVHPERMHSFLTAGGKQGLVCFKVITEHRSREDIVAALAKEASNTLLEGKLEKNLERLEVISKASIPAELKADLLRISKDRNRIVHEAHVPSLGMQDVMDTFGRLHDLLNWYGAVAEKQGVPVNDPAGLMKT